MRTKSQMGWQGVTAIGALFGVVGVFFLYLAYRNRKKARSTLTWPTVPGRVESSTVIERTHRSKGARHYTFEPRIVYRYTVGGQEYESSRIAYGPPLSGSRGRAEALAKTYDPANEVTVHYDPSNPAEAVLDTAPGGGNSVYVILGMIFTLSGSGVAAAGLLLVR